jgi:hypothetical protein
LLFVAAATNRDGVVRQFETAIRPRFRELQPEHANAIGYCLSGRVPEMLWFLKHNLLAF